MDRGGGGGVLTFSQDEEQFRSQVQSVRGVLVSSQAELVPWVRSNKRSYETCGGAERKGGVTSGKD